MAEAVSFADFIKESREKKKNEALAQQFLGSRGRKANASGAGSLNARATPQKPTLLSRMSSTSGVQKQRSSSAKPSVASIDGKWQHDLHKLNNPNGPPPKRLNRTASASQIDRNTRNFDKFTSALRRNEENSRRNNEADSTGFNIRGVAKGGPYTICASNFAPGTTAADIEAVMAPHGGEMLGCRVVVSYPTVMAELIFPSREGADNVIATFNNKKADGRVLYVYHKEGPPAPSAAPLHTRPSRAAHSYDDMDVDTNGGARAGSFQDGRYGFADNERRQPPRGPRKRY